MKTKRFVKFESTVFEDGVVFIDCNSIEMFEFIHEYNQVQIWTVGNNTRTVKFDGDVHDFLAYIGYISKRTSDG